MVQVGKILNRIVVFVLVVHGTLQPLLNIGTIQLGQRPAAVLQKLVQLHFRLLTGGGEGFRIPAGGGVGEGNGANHGGEQGFAEHNELHVVIMMCGF